MITDEHYYGDEFLPTVDKIAGHQLFIEFHTACIGWNLNGNYKGFDFTTVWATPFWDGNDETIDCQLADDEGNYEDAELSIPFALKDLTGDAEVDARRYLKLVGEEIAKKFQTR